MARLDVVGTWTRGPEPYVMGIRDSVTHVLNREIRLYTASSGLAGGLMAWRASGTLIDTAALVRSSDLGARTGLEIATLEGRAALLVYGLADAGVAIHWIADDGALSSAIRLPASAGTFQAFASLDTTRATLFFSTARDGPRITVWRLKNADQLMLVDQYRPSGAGSNGDIVALQGVVVDGQLRLLALNGATSEVISMRAPRTSSPGEPIQRPSLWPLQLPGAGPIPGVCVSKGHLTVS